jgi:hypothetical protein
MHVVEIVEGLVLDTLLLQPTRKAVAREHPGRSKGHAAIRDPVADVDEG